MMILANEIGRLVAYGANAPTTGHIPMFDSATGKTTYVTSDQIASGANAVDGPSSATDGVVVLYNGTTGKIIKNSVTYPTVTTRCSGSVTVNGSASYVNVTGLTATVVPGTYEFVCRLPSTVASGTAGIKYAFNYTTAVLSGMEATGRGFTASAVAVQHTTTTTTQTDLFTQAAVVIYTEITGTMVVTTGGTVDLQVSQNTSNASNTISLVGGTLEFTRIA